MALKKHTRRLAPVVFGLLCCAVPGGWASASGDAATAPSDSRPAAPNAAANVPDNPAAQPPAGQQDNQPLFRNDGGNRAYNPGSPVDYPALDVRDWMVANAMAARARAMYSRAQSELDASIRSAQHHFDRSQDFQDAQAGEKQAYDDYIAARQRALASVMHDEKYRALTSLRDELGDKLAVRRTQKDATREEILAMATLKMQYASDARAMEVAALDGDENVKNAKAKMVAASRKVSQMRASFDDAVRDNAQIAQARRNVADARVGMLETSSYAASAAAASASAINYAYWLHRNDNGGVYGPYGYSPYAYSSYGYASPYWTRY